MFAYPDINTPGVGRIRDSYVTKSRVCKTVSNSPNPRVFISGYAHTENVFYCLNNPIERLCLGGPVIVVALEVINENKQHFDLITVSCYSYIFKDVNLVIHLSM